MSFEKRETFLLSDDDSYYTDITKSYFITGDTTKFLETLYHQIEKDNIIFTRDETPELFTLTEINNIFYELNETAKQLHRFADNQIAIFGSASKQLYDEILPPLLKALAPFKELLEAEAEQKKNFRMCPKHNKPMRGGQCAICIRKSLRSSGNRKQN